MLIRKLPLALKRILIIFTLSGLSFQAIAEDTNPDPYESFNRKMFAVNEFLDKWLLKPAATGYRWVTPDLVDDAITNVFSNLAELRNLLNAGLQGEGRHMLDTTGRFLLNSTLGVAGIMDVATSFGLEEQTEDFGQTLAVWGVGDGPYIVLPFLGGRTFRDTFAMIPDAYTTPLNYIDDTRTRNGLRILELIDMRADLINAEVFISGDRYLFLRDVYLQKRNSDINNGLVEDDFDDYF